ELIGFAMEGEALASGARHADNAAPCLLGGFVLVRSVEPLDVVRLAVPELWAVVIHPHIEIRTADARSILPKMVSLSDAVRQWSNLGAFVSGLASGDYELITRSMEDVI
ncbi:MAG TPA: homoserine kinase, partial [Blastocatellia bacterium]|nr:homoserine kinase [Blastocatellia bacterium]